MIATFAHQDMIDAESRWFGSVPHSWKILPLYGCCTPRNRSNIGLRETNVLSLSYGRVIRRWRGENEGLLPDSYETYQIVEPGEIILRLTDLQNDQRSLRTALVSERGIITSAYICLGVDKEAADSRFAAYVFRAIDTAKVFYGLGGGLRQTMRFEDLKRIPLPLPTLNVQRAIAAFLDRETARIDALIEKKQRLIELLEEKRQAVITQAVTRGLDPDVPMKDSGVEWLGRMPAHWRLSRVKFLTTLVTSGSRGWSDLIADAGVRFLQSGSLNDDMGVDVDTSPFVALPASAEGVRTKVRSNDVLVCITGAKTGRVGLLGPVSEEAYVNQHLALVRPDTRLVSAEWLAIVLWSDIGQETFALRQYGLKEGLALGDVLDTPVPLPPREEQNAIADLIRKHLRTTAKEPLNLRPYRRQ